jgi:hypothetical protein
MSKALDILNKRYFEWMCQLVCGEDHPDWMSYQKLLSYLHDRDFVYTIGFDGNRAADGVDLRYRFAYEHHYNNTVLDCLDRGACSVLEMMVALAIKCEEYMDDPEIGDQTGRWFWDMVASLGLTDMTDLYFDESHVNQVITKFLGRNYSPNGKGGLFTVRRSKHDLREVEIWHQMCWYLNDI